MNPAINELRREPSRFAPPTTILTLIALLLMFLGGLLDGLIRNSTGAVNAIDTDLIVFSESSQGSFLRSRIEPETRQAIEDAVGTTSGGLGVTLLGARVPGNGPRDLANVAVWGYESPIEGVPAPPAAGTGWADERLRADGVEVGDELLVGPSRTPVMVAGWVSNTAYNGQSSLWVDVETWHTVLNQNRPDAALAPGVFQALAVSAPEGGSPESAAATIAAVDPEGDLLVLTVAETRDAIPGVTEQQRTFNQILGVTVLIALVVVALFFALLTVERTSLYAVFKALGAGTRSIFIGLVAQAIAVTTVAALLAAVAVVAIDAALPAGSVPLFVSPQRIIVSTLLLFVAAVVGCAFSLRRVLRVDPATALGGSS